MSSKPTPPILEAQHLKKQFKDGQRTVDVLHDVSLSIKPGERVGIIGSSGSGKSTLLHLLGGVDTPTTGTVNVAGHCLSKQPQAKRGRLRNQYLGFVYQFHYLLPEFNAIENVAMPLLIRGGVSLNAAKTQAAVLLDNVGLSHRYHHHVGTLSGGERQRVAIARALVTQPACVLADEPTGNLDAHTASSIYTLIEQLSQTFKTSFVLVTHDIQLAERMDRILTLKEGHLAS